MRCVVSPEQKHGAGPPDVRGDRPPASERGYVLFIVLIVGVAAGIAAVSLTTTRGGSEIAAIHTEVGDRSQLIAEAGMQRAVFFLNDYMRTQPDFDGVLDVGLDATCNGPGSPDPAPNDLRPPVGGGPMQWSDAGASVEQIGEHHYTCVPFGGGRYCVHFEDDDDDGTFEEGWDPLTGNNEDGAGGCDPNGCLEGPAPGNCPNHNGGQRNGLRDRNRAIYVVAVGIYPDVPYAEATHKTTLRRFHIAPLHPSNAGLKIKGNMTVTGKGGGWYACSDVAGVEIAGDVKHFGVGCTSGISFAKSWAGSAECDTDEAKFCGKADWDGMAPVDAIGGGQFTPGPSLPPMPNVWASANTWVDFSRECLFWVEWGYHGSASPAERQRTIVGKWGAGGADAHQLWWWDADEPRGPNGELCADFETKAGPNAAMPGPPNPGRAGQPGSLTDPDDWAGCWSPLLIDAGQFDANDAWPNLATSLGLGVLPVFNTDEHDCWHPPFHNGAGIPIAPERPLNTGPCAWRPSSTAGQYTVCRGGAHCTAVGRRPVGLPGEGPLNQRLGAEGMPKFPTNVDVRLSKPNWQDACRINYPPDGTVVDGVKYSPTEWKCEGCDGSRNVLESIGSGGLWFQYADHAAVTAAPAGVYYFTNGVASSFPTGASIDWKANAATPAGTALPWTKLGDWPLTTVMTDGSIKLQRSGFTFGIGQEHPGLGNDGPDSMWSRYASWIVGGTLSLQGGGTSATAGSIYAGSGAAWTGNGTYYVFGQLYTDGDFETTGSAEFYWLYRVDLGNGGPAGGAGMFPTQTPIAQ